MRAKREQVFVDGNPALLSDDYYFAGVNQIERSRTVHRVLRTTAAGGVAILLTTSAGLALARQGSSSSGNLVSGTVPDSRRSELDKVRSVLADEAEQLTTLRATITDLEAGVPAPARDTTVLPTKAESTAGLTPIKPPIATSDAPAPSRRSRSTAPSIAARTPSVRPTSPPTSDPPTGRTQTTPPSNDGSPDD